MSFPDVVLLALCVVGLGLSLVAVFMMARSWLAADDGAWGLTRGIELAIGAAVVLALYSALDSLGTYALSLALVAGLLSFVYIRLTRA